jgi:hypothetical protein
MTSREQSLINYTSSVMVKRQTKNKHFQRPPKAVVIINLPFRTSWVILVLVVLIPGSIRPAHAGASNSRIHREHREYYDRVLSSPTFVLERNVRLQGDTRTLTFLFDNLDVSGDLLSTWDLGHFEVTQEKDRFYRATKGDDLAGTCYQLFREPGRVVFVGEGVYRPDHSPIDVPGTAVVSIEWEQASEGGEVYELVDRETGEVELKGSRDGLLFGSDDRLRAIADVYAAGEEKFVEDFVDAWRKVMTNDRFDLK